MSVRLLHPPRTCLGCVHLDTGEPEEEVRLVCELAQELVDDERIGADCPDYTPGDHPVNQRRTA